MSLPDMPTPIYKLGMVIIGEQQIMVYVPLGIRGKRDYPLLYETWDQFLIVANKIPLMPAAYPESMEKEFGAIALRMGLAPSGG